MNEYRYKNPFSSGPDVYVRYPPPIWERHGCQIYKVLDNQFDLVKNGVCMAQRCGKDGLKILAQYAEQRKITDHKELREVHDMLVETGRYEKPQQLSLF